MKKIFQFLVSTKVSMVLLFIFAVAMAVATFVENDYGTQVARAQVYEAWWFELLMLWLSINFIFHIKKYNLLSKKKLVIGLFHIAFVIIILGAGITRFFGTEGNMSIREGQAVNYFLSAEKYAQIKFEDQLDLALVNIIPYSFSGIDKSLELNDEKFNFKVVKYFKAAIPELKEGKDTIMEMAISRGQGREDLHVVNRAEIPLPNAEKLSFNYKNPSAFIQIFKENGAWKIKSREKLSIVEMMTQKMSVLPADTVSNLVYNTLYQWGDATFLVKDIAENKQQSYSEAPQNLEEFYPKMVEVEITDADGKNIAKSYFPFTNKAPEWKSFQYKGKTYQYTFGSEKKFLPFALKLNKFEIERYPGSQSPSGYASDVQVIDKEEDKDFEFKIYMNHVLDYRGYRFYQSSYDADEQGTLLSVNKDRLGTLVTYTGYALLFICMILTLFAKASRFSILNKRLSKIKKSINLILFFALGMGAMHAQDFESSITPQEKANEYGRLVVQDLDGRMKPLTTLAYEISRKLNGKTNIAISTADKTYKLSPEQFLLAIQIDPKLYSQIPIFKVDDEKLGGLLKKMNLPVQKYYAFDDLIDEKGTYLLHDEVERVNRLKASDRNDADKELLKLDERFNIFYGVVMGDFLRLFPNKNAENNEWFTAKQSQKDFTPEDATFVQNIGKYYLSALSKANAQPEFNAENYKDADESLLYISAYQKEIGKEVYPSETMIAAETFYTKANIGNYLFGFFMVLGIILLVVNILGLFSMQKSLNSILKVGYILSFIGFLVFTFDLGLRWYIAKHPPWSDGFEMMLFVSWGVLLFGLLFSKKSSFALPVGLLFSGVLLFVSFLDWLNPEITNLKPVLHSYWLKIHVAVIVGSYAPLALSAVLALLSLVLIIFKPKMPSKRWWAAMQEMSIVNEMSLTIGLFLLTIGTFLGGIWANESWGRYWAWDPKETWALISIMVYAIVLHLRLIPKLANALMYNLCSMWAFASIIMTSYGVNYYLSGLHSYAKGDPVPVPVWVYWAVVIFGIISVLAAVKFYKLNKNEQKKLR
ncbi:cytochrome c biogenesis protein CcsA [Ornithobacterium rhinotracheale]|uniref:cytochrome c biogenesis protein CcsA n=1 Tax=Ornithobacterium rhinotracheale TaxID=28251 RepID=UPI0040355AD8